MKKIYTRRALAAFFSVVVSLALWVDTAARDIQLYVDGAAVAFDTAPQIVDGRTMVPFRAMFEALGAEVTWEEETKTALCKRGQVELRITQGEALAMLNNRPVYMDAPPILVNDRLLVAARYASECFGYTVLWQEETETVLIEKGPSLPKAYQEIAGSRPRFEETLLSPYAFESYHELDALGRCGEAMACIGQELMPTEERGAIGMIRPSGWQMVRYDNVEGGYLYNRCHLIGYQLSGENKNDRNLITGTRFFNIQGMLPFENRVAAYIKDTGNHVLYRVVPLYRGEDLLSSGVTMEAYSIEDDGAGICFFVFLPNYQPGIFIDYATGASEKLVEVSEAEDVRYILNTKTKKFHLPSCPSAEKIAEKNREETSDAREEVLKEGFSPCAICKP